MKTVGSQIKRLDDGIVDLTNQLAELDKDSEVDAAIYKDLRKKLAALNEILAYVNTYKWLSHSSVIDKLKEIRKCGFDYALIEREMEMTNDALKSFMRRVNNNLNEKIGNNTVKKVLSGNISEAMMTFRILSGTYSLKEAMLPQVFNILPDKKFTTFSLKECVEEIEFLYNFSNIYYKGWFSSLDMDKLAFLRYILETETEKYADDQKNLMLAFQGNSKMPFEKLMEYIDNKVEVSVE